VLEWGQSTDLVNYRHLIAEDPDPGPPTLWVEWVFRSNHPIGPAFYSCDAFLITNYNGSFEVVYMYGDAAISFSGDIAVFGLALDEFHTFRYESLNGIDYTVSVDGDVFIIGSANFPTGGDYIQFGGYGGCGSDVIPDARNEWDMIRYGTISYGEKIVASDPAARFVDPCAHPALDRFTVTYDTPNYVYIDEIAVAVNGAPLPGGNPRVIATRRLDNGPPDVVEVVLDRPIPRDRVITFTFDDGVAENVIQYRYRFGDTDGDRDMDLLDWSRLQNCFGHTIKGPSNCDSDGPQSGPYCCCAFDVTGDTAIDHADISANMMSLTGPN